MLRSHSIGPAIVLADSTLNCPFHGKSDGNCSQMVAASCHRFSVRDLPDPEPVS
jgi:hypothetical protein